MDTYMDTYTHTYKDIVELLLLAGANPWHIDKENMTAFEGTNFSKQKCHVSAHMAMSSALVHLLFKDTIGSTFENLCLQMA